MQSKQAELSKMMRKLFVALVILATTVASTTCKKSAKDTETVLLRIADKVENNKKLSTKNSAQLLEIFDKLAQTNNAEYFEQQKVDELLHATVTLIIDGITNKTLEKKPFMAELKKNKIREPLREKIKAIKPKQKEEE